MMECRNCPTGNVVPVLDISMTNQAKGGNPYRTLCLECGIWNQMTSKETWKNHPHPHVLPHDSDPDDDDPTIPLEDWDESQRFQNVLDRLDSLRTNQGGQEAADEPDQEEMSTESAEEIRQQHRGETSEASTDGDDGDSDDGDQNTAGINLPMPSLNKRHLAILAVIVLAVAVWMLYRQSEEADTQQWTDDVEIQPDEQTSEQHGDDDGRDDEMEVPTNDPDPLAADEAVTQQFRDRGVISDPEWG